MGITVRRRPRRLLRGALALATVGAGLLAAPAPPGSLAHPPRAMLASAKPGWRVDAADTGVLATAGPVAAPALVLDVAPGWPGGLAGVLLDAAGDAVVGAAGGRVLAYAPDGAPAWSADAGATGGSPLGGPAQVALGADGAAYVGSDNGTLYQLAPAAAAGSPPVAPSCPIFATPGGARLAMAPQLGGGGALYIGDDAGTLYALAPPAPPGPGAPCPAPVAPAWAVAATGSTQRGGAYDGVASAAPFAFYGQAALDGAGTVYAASTDGNPAYGNSPTLGTLYALDAASGAVRWRYPLRGAATGAVAYDAAEGAVVAADRGGEVLAVRAAGPQAGSLLWRAPFAAPFAASPALSPDGRTVYTADADGALHALAADTGAAAAGFGDGGRVATGGGGGAPVVDAAGRLYLVTAAGEVVAYSPAGAELWRLPAGAGPGASGTLGAGTGSPAIAADGTLYVAGNLGRLRGFRAAPPGGTPTPAASASATGGAVPFPTATAPPDTATPTPDVSPTAAPTTIPGDLPQLNEANAHYTRGADGLVHVRLYLAPVGVPARQGWLLRDPSLGLSVAPPTAPGTAATTPATQLATATTPGTAPATARPAAGAARARLALAATAASATAADSATAPAPTTTPASSTATVAPSDTPAPPAAPPPFRVRAAPDSAPGSATTIAGEDGATLGIALAAVGGATPAAVPARLSGDTAAYPAALGSAADYSVRQTVSGLDLRVTLHAPPADPSVALDLALDPGENAAQDSRGIAIRRPVQQCGGGGPGDCITLTQTEYRLGPAAARDGAPGAAALVATGPVSATLAAAPSGATRLTLRLDPGWLADPARAYPVTLDLPVATAAADDQTGVFGTVGSCAPGMPATQGEVTVGAAGPCTYHGVAYFDLAHLSSQQAIQSATLHLYTPDQAGDSGVQVAPNAPGPTYAPPPTATAGSGAAATAIPLPAIQRGILPTWDTMPAAGPTAMARSASDGHWQTWDVTGAVRGWARDRLTNTGLTSAGAPVRFAAPLDVGAGGPAQAPYLDIAFAFASPAVARARTAQSAAAVPCGTSTTTAYADCAAGMYGLDGRVYRAGYCATLAGVGAATACDRGIEFPNVGSNSGGGQVQLNAQLIRISVELPCNLAFQTHTDLTDPW